MVQNGRCAGQKSPNENGPLRQKLMTGDQKSKISIQHFELFRVAGHPFALQMLSIPLPLSLHSASLCSSLAFFPCLELENGPASGLVDTFSASWRKSFAHAKQEIICHFQQSPGSMVTVARKQIKQRSEHMHSKPLEGLGNIMSMSYSIRTFNVRKKAHLISTHLNARGNKQYKIERKRKK